jgi:hypothetical protein
MKTRILCANIRWLDGMQLRTWRPEEGVSEEELLARATAELTQAGAHLPQGPRSFRWITAEGNAAEAEKFIGDAWVEQCRRRAAEQRPAN